MDISLSNAIMHRCRRGGGRPNPILGSTPTLHRKYLFYGTVVSMGDSEKTSYDILCVQRGASDHSQGFFEDKNSGSSPGLLGQYDILCVQSGASDHSQGFEDKNSGSSPGLLGQ